MVNIPTKVHKRSTVSFNKTNDIKLHIIIQNCLSAYTNKYKIYFKVNSMKSGVIQESMNGYQINKSIHYIHPKGALFIRSATRFVSDHIFRVPDPVH